MTRTLRSVDIGDHVTPQKRYFLTIADIPSDPATVDVNARLVMFLQEVLAQPSLLAVGPVATASYTVKHDGEKWSVKGEGESAQ